MDSKAVTTLLDNIDRIHTTEMGINRIKRNLNLDVDEEEVVDYCIDKIRKYDEILLKGKNYYVHVDNMTFTVNRNTFTIITAHLE